MGWLLQNMGNIVVIAILALIVGAIIVKLIKDKKKGKSPCGCDCGHCGMSGSCKK